MESIMIKKRPANKKNKNISAKKQKTVKSTYDEYVDSLSPKRKKEFNEDLKNFALSEFILALMEKDEVSVRKLAELADVSPTVVQAMRSGINKDFTLQSFFKVLNGLGCKKFIIEHNGELIPLGISSAIKR